MLNVGIIAVVGRTQVIKLRYADCSVDLHVEVVLQALPGCSPAATFAASRFPVLPSKRWTRWCMEPGRCVGLNWQDVSEFVPVCVTAGAAFVGGDGTDLRLCCRRVGIGHDGNSIGVNRCGNGIGRYRRGQAWPRGRPAKKQLKRTETFHGAVHVAASAAIRQT